MEEVNATMRVTEMASPMTPWLDLGESVNIVRMLASCDSALFTGYAGLPCVQSPAVVAQCARMAVAVARALRHPRGRVLFAGCGTSGRLGQLLSRELNAHHHARAASQTPRFGYLLAGGDGALLVPNEAVEDRHEAGRDDLREWEQRQELQQQQSGASGSGDHSDEEPPPLVLIGISCGLSATYVASLLRAGAARGPSCFCVALGFNPLPAVAHVVVPGCPFTFYSVLCAMTGQASEPSSAAQGPSATADALPQRCAVINPVVGGEAVAGSSRMKGGSITWILCSAICMAAMADSDLLAGAGSFGMHVRDEDVPAGLVDTLRHHFLRFEVCISQLYSWHTDAVASILSAAAASLTMRHGPRPDDVDAVMALAAALAAPAPAPRRLVSPTGTGRILYIGRGAGGMLGLVDASEATDTYGDLFDHVRGWVAGGPPRMGLEGGTTHGGSTAWRDPVVPLELRGFHGPAAQARAVAAGVPPQTACPALASFHVDVVPTLTAHDTVIVVDVPQPNDTLELVHAELREVEEAAAAALAAGAGVHYVVIAAPPVPPVQGPRRAPRAHELRALALAPHTGALESESGAQAALVLALHRGGAAGGVHMRLADMALSGLGGVQWHLAAQLLAVQACKLALNAVTTGAHVRKGVVVGNRMCNMMLTNVKLFHRAAGIVAEVAGVSATAALVALLRAIHDDDDGGGRVAAWVAAAHAEPSSLMAHIAAATRQDRVIPTALLLAMDGAAAAAAGAGGAARPPLTVAAARALLDAEPGVRRAMALVA